jgi:hypothetical protein
MLNMTSPILHLPECAMVLARLEVAVFALSPFAPALGIFRHRYMKAAMRRKDRPIANAAKAMAVVTSSSNSCSYGYPTIPVPLGAWPTKSYSMLKLPEAPAYLSERLRKTQMNWKR